LPIIPEEEEDELLRKTGAENQMSKKLNDSYH